MRKILSQINPLATPGFLLPRELLILSACCPFYSHTYHLPMAVHNIK
uniref:Uncharacterized protein n=1 Tax=Arundo donax TaxID=35708 RepID=A0A0A8XWS0_ARUDO